MGLFMHIAVLIPCYNEAVAISKVVGDFRAALPDAAIWVFDNNSRDGTAQIAASEGASVKHVGLQGKGHVVRRQFADVDADVYIMVDGDDTYHAESAQQMVRCLVEGGMTWWWACAGRWTRKRLTVRAMSGETAC
jgi:glycosyltransferase involved in cell wall biosynthesis